MLEGQAQAPDHGVGPDEARVIITVGGRTGDLPATVDRHAAHEDVRRMVQEALRGGGVAGLPAMPDVDLTDYIIDPCEPNAQTPYWRLLARPKTAFGA
jgi:hypothetical protein